VVIFFACKRENVKISTKETAKVLPLSMKAPLSGNKEAPGGCNCSGHGGAVAASISWELATCKSNCEKGIGFRCGREGVIVCADGTACIFVAGSNCPGHVMNPDRKMEAGYTFYSNNTLKLTFKNAVPLEEQGNTVFEIEGDDFINLHPDLLIGGIHYRGYTVQNGSYYIDYSDGPFGSVTLKIVLNP